MTKQISDYTTDELSAKIEAIKAERERTANALNRYEEELERRKQEAFQRRLDVSNLYENWLKALVAVSKEEPIDIKVLLPLLKKGWVCYSPELGWAWCSNDGKITCGKDRWYSTGENWLLNAFNLKPAKDWETSLMECGL